MQSLTYKIEHLGLDGEAELKIFDNAKIVGDRALVKVGREFFGKGMQDAIDGLNAMAVKPGIL